MFSRVYTVILLLSLAAHAGAPGGILPAEFVSLPGGLFLMGSIEEWEGNSNEFPARTVHVDGFEIMTTEVPQVLWMEYMGENPSRFHGDSLPVEGVSFHMCMEFIDRLNMTDDGYVYSLPSEAQWEYACRAGTATPFPWGELCRGEAFCRCTSGGTTVSVRCGTPNDFGLLNMCGNVWEWCADDYFPDYTNAPSDHSPRRGQEELPGVVRGGAWAMDPQHCRSAWRVPLSREFTSSLTGFRLVRTPVENTGLEVAATGD